MKKIVYIDGQNFLYKAAEILIEAGRITDKSDLTKIDIRGIFEHIFEADIEVKFYGAKVKIRKDKGEEILNKSRRFSDTSRRIRNTLNAQAITFVESGKLKLRDSDKCKNCLTQDLKFQEKGVDVGVAVDMIVDRFKTGVEQTILVSSDTDLLPAIKAVKDDGGEVVYVGFSDKLTNAIVAESSQTEIIRDNEIINAYDLSNQPKLDL
jgi:uncharacterized LabA/DUF88 family protein